LFHEVEMSSYPLFDFPLYTLALASKMVEVAQFEKLDILHCHYAIPHSVSAFLAKSMMHPRRLPVVTTLHGTDITLVGADRSYLPITRFSIEKSDGVTAVSQYLRDATYSTFGVTKRIEVIYNFVNCDNYIPRTSPAIPGQYAPGGEKILIHLSNFRPVKRPGDVVEIFNLVRREVDCVLLMVGDGPERSYAEWLARDHGLEKHVHFLGKRQNIEELIASADVLLLPSDNESFGLVALEAMACEVPAIVSRVGGTPEVITDGEDGFLIEPRNIEQMAARSIEILSDEQRRREMGRCARRNARARFCASKIIPRYEAFYRDVINAM
jgi:N-acetyl-alpha-D-glucosaminyl L-malate synthase BshA